MYAFPLILLSMTCITACGRHNVLQGEVTGRQSYNSNVDLASQDAESEWRSTLSPGFTLSSRTGHSAISLHYRPSFIFNYRTEEESVDHYAALASSYEGERLRLSLRDIFTRSDTPIDDEELDITLSERRGTSLYTTNAVRGDLGYRFSGGSLFGLSYSHHLLDNDNPGLEDHIRHSPSASLHTIFSPHWQTGLTYRYTYGDFDHSSDLSMHTGDFRLHYNKSATLSYMAHYSYSSTDYYTEPTDYHIQNSTLGFERRFSPASALRLEAGISQLYRDYAPVEETPCVDLQLTRAFEHASVNLLGRAGFEELQFTGTPESDTLSRYWETRLNVTHELDINLTSAIFGMYHRNRLIERVPTEEEAHIKAGATITYTFHRWYSFGLHYLYSLQQADTRTREYESHQFYIELTARKDLASW